MVHVAIRAVMEFATAMIMAVAIWVCGPAMEIRVLINGLRFITANIVK